MLRKNRGITLVALVITIIILLVLAGISISALTNTGLFGKAKEAKEKTREAEENQSKTLSEYEKAMDINNENTLVYKVNNGTIKIGDYVSYEPDTVASIDEQYKKLISNLKTYSGSDANTESTLTQEKLSWRVLDIKDGQVRLISATPTTSLVTLYGYNGYNNAVKLLDDASSTLYNNSKLVSKVQNIKIEDIQEKMKTDYKTIDTDYEKTFKPENKLYPSILPKEKNQIINKNVGTELDLSEQNNLIKQTEKNQADELNIKYTYWCKQMDDHDFDNSKYYELIINNNGNYTTYWMSSRCIRSATDYIRYRVRYVYAGSIDAIGLYHSNGGEDSRSCSFRPIITLNSNVQVDRTKSANGNTAEQAYAIK